jgi:hypothetical protein
MLAAVTGHTTIISAHTTAAAAAATTLLCVICMLGKYEEAGGHAVKCYQHYLDGTHSEDTDVLTRLGNLQVCCVC